MNLGAFGKLRMVHAARRKLYRVRRRFAVLVYQASAAPTPIRALASPLLAAYGKRGAKLACLEDEAIRDWAIAEPSPSISVVPDGLGGQPKRHDTVFPAIRARLFHGLTMNSQSGQLVHDNKVLIPRNQFNDVARIESSGGSLSYYDLRCCVGGKPTQQIENGIAVTGNGSFNWYHFMMEILPSAFLSARLPPELSDFPLLVPEECETIASFRDALEAVNQFRKVIVLRSTQNYQVRNLVMIDPVVVSPFNMNRNVWPTVDDYRQHEVILRDYFAAMKNSLGITASEGTDRVFIVRSNRNRSYNEAALVDMAIGRGFKAVAPEKLSLREQARLISSCGMMIGASGSAWVNMMFRSHPLVGLSWLIPQYKGFCTYSNLARIMGHDLSFIEAAPIGQINCSGDAFIAEYRVDRKRFADHLDRICDRFP